MKHKLIVISVIVAFILLIAHGYNNFFTKGMLIGIYINQNYSYSSNLVEIPLVPDTLSLFKNNQFVSNYWGKGTYKIFYTVRGTNIELFYKYQFGKAGYKTSIERLNFGRPKVILKRF